MLELLKYYDTQLLLLINGHHTIFFDQLMLFSSDKLAWIPFYMLLLFFIFKEKGRKGFLVLLFIGLSIALSDQTSVHAFKNVFLRLRPCHQPALEGLVRIVNHCGGSYGFVSSHATNSFALIGFLIMLLAGRKRWLHLSLWFWGVFIIYSRVYLGVHYPGDVIAGSIVGLALGIASFKLFEFTERKLYR